MELIYSVACGKSETVFRRESGQTTLMWFFTRYLDIVMKLYIYIQALFLSLH
jgi:hypothetical protein